MKKGGKENGVPVACIPERVVANVAVAAFLERATSTSDLTTGFVLPHGHFIPQIQLHSRRCRRPSAAARSPHTLYAAPHPRFHAAPPPPPPTPPPRPPPRPHPRPRPRPRHRPGRRPRPPDLNAAPEPRPRPRRRLPLPRRRHPR